MSAPKRAAKTTSSPSQKTAKAASRKSPAPSSPKPTTKAAKKSAVKAPAKKKTAKAAAPSSPKAATGAKKTSATKTAKPSTAQRVAKKVAKIISKIVAKKKTVVKKPAAAPAKAKAATVKPKAKKTATKAASKRKATPANAKPAAVKRAPAKSPKTGAVTRQATAPRRPKSFAPRDVERDFGFPASAPELPELYGEDRLVLMTKDPEYLFAYWEITPAKKAEGEKIKHRREEYREALRLNWASRDIFERNFAMLPVTLEARKWYLRVPFSGLAYQVEIGWLGESGHFISLLTSNPSDAPESWAATRRRLKGSVRRGGILERALEGSAPQGSSDLASKSPAVAPAPYDWNFPGPGSQTSSPGMTKKPGRRAAR